jgi:glycosyltransferase involved in cell wall biosynthesis
VAVAFSAGEVVAMPSRHEPWGRVAVEAMACGVPLVAGAAGHLPDLVGEHGRLVRPGDADDLARALREALEEPEPERAKRVAAAREYAAGFSWAALAERWHAVYDEVVAGNGARP